MNRCLSFLFFIAAMPLCASMAFGQTLARVDEQSTRDMNTGSNHVTSPGSTQSENTPDGVASTTAASRVAFAQQPKDAKAGAIISPAVTARLKDIFGRNVEQSGVTISLSISSGTGQLSGTTERNTNDQGLATFDDLSIDLIGSKRLRASSAGLQSATSKSFDIKLGPAVRLQIQGEPSDTATAGLPFSQQPVVWVVDAGGNLVTDDNSTVVTASRLAGVGALQGTVVATARKGIVSFANLSHNVAGTMTILFTSGALLEDTSSAILVKPAAAAQLIFLQHPTNTTAGTVITPPVTVSLRDAFGNDVKTSGTLVGIALTSGSGSINGTLTRSTVSGVATFNDLSIDLTGSKRLTASSGSLSVAVSDTFTISAKTAKALAFVQQPTNAKAGSTVAPPVTVQLRDSLGNDVLLAGVNITLQLSSGTGTLNGTKTKSTDGTGLASFNDLSINRTGQKTLRATSGVLTADLSVTFAITSATESQLTFVQQPTNTVAGQIISPSVTVQLRDAFGNDVAKAGVSVLMALAPGSSGLLSGTTTQLTDPSGLATFSNLSVDLVGVKTLTAVATGLNSPLSSSFIVSPAPPSRLVFREGPSNSIAGVAFPTQPTIELQDQHQNLVIGVAQDITIAIQTNAGQTGTLKGSTTIAIDTLTGTGTYSGLSIDKSGIGYTLTVTGSTVSTIPGAVVSGPFDVDAAPASQVRVETEADGGGTLLGTQTVSSGTSITVYAIARDEFENFVENAVATSWSLLELTGGVVPTDLLASADRRSATFNGGAVGSAVISAVVSGWTSVPSGTVTVVNNATATRILVETAANGAGAVVQDQTLPSGSSLLVYAIARDLNNNFVANVAAEDWSLDNTTGGIVSGDLVSSADRKSATLTGRLVGTARIRATLADLIPTSSGTITVSSGAPFAVVATAGTPQSTAVGTLFGTRLSATVRDVAGNPISGLAVTFDVPSSGASASFEDGMNTVLTDAIGVALAPGLTANSVAGTYNVVASAIGAPTAAIFVLTNSSRAVGRITAVEGALQSTQVGTTFPTRFAASVQDSFGNPVVGAEVFFSAPASGPSGTFSGGELVATATTNESGIGTAPEFASNLTAGTYAVTATAADVASPALFALTNTAGSAASITSIVGVQQSAQVNSAFSTPFQAVVQDAAGNLVSGVLVTFLAPEEGPSGAFPGGGVINVATDTNGTATAPTFVANTLAGTYAVLAYAQGVGTPSSFQLTNRAAPLNAIRIEAEGGGNIGTQMVRVPFNIRIIALDGYGNIATSFTGAVDLSSSGALTEGAGTTPPFTGGVLAQRTVAVQNAGRVVLFALRTGGAESGRSDTFQVNNPVPEVTSISPSHGARGESMILKVTGSGFLQGVTSVILGNNITTYETAASDTQITVALNIGSGALEGPRSVLVINSPPGGGIVSVDNGFVVEGVVYPTAYTLQSTIVFPSHSQNADFDGSDYRIVGLPGAGDLPMQQILSGSQNQDWVAFWDNGASSDYLVPFNGTTIFNFSPGRAFWVLHRGPLVMSTTVPTLPLDSSACVQIPLHQGWNLISNPFTIPVAWSDVQAANEPEVLGGVYTFDGSFEVPDVLPTYEGCLYDNTGNMPSLVIPYREASLLKPGVTAEESWRVKVELTVRDYVERFVSFGVSPGAEIGRDEYDFRRPRSVTSLPEVYFDLPEVAGDEIGPFATDIRPVTGDLATWQLEIRAHPREAARISFYGLESIPNENSVMLIDHDRGRLVDLRIEPGYDFTPVAPVSHFRIAVGSETAVRAYLGDALPREFSLGNNFPNPFNPSTTISVTIPWTSKVALRVYTLLGEVVRTLYVGSLTEGRYWFEWDGTTDQGRAVAAGIYFMQLTNDQGQRFIQKMVLLK